MPWEALVALLGVGGLWAFTYLKNKGKGASEYEIKDARLQGKQEAKQEELDTLEDKIARVEEKLSRLKDPKDIENHWNKKD